MILKRVDDIVKDVVKLNPHLNEKKLMDNLSKSDQDPLTVIFV